MSRPNEASIQQAMAAFEHQLSQERDKGMADGARLFLYRFKETHGCTPLDALEGGRIAAREANLGLQWGKAACAYIAELEDRGKEKPTQGRHGTIQKAYAAGWEAGAMAAKEDHDWCEANEVWKDIEIMVREFLDSEPDPADAYDFVCKLDAVL